MAFGNLLKQFLFNIAFWPYIINKKKVDSNQYFKKLVKVSPIKTKKKEKKKIK
jgi:hypothetical protein